MTGASLALLAAEPTWTDKEVLSAVGTAAVAILGAFVTLGGLVHRSLTAVLRGKLRDTERELRETKVAIAGLGDLAIVRDKLEKYETLHKRLHDAGQQVGSLTEQLKCVREEAEGYKTVNHGLTGERDALKAEAEQLTRLRDEALADAKAKQNQIKKAIQKDGAIWAQPIIKEKYIEFRPLDPDKRRTPIISMLNLKGGVGKTTATANLAAALAHRGYRVLLVDLDLQGSLTGMFMSESEQKQAHEHERLVGDFLEASFDAEFPNLMDYARPVAGFPTRSMLVPTTDAQAYAEMNLTVRWFLRDSKRDPRFLLRKQLQLVQVTSKFDVILLDCPPLLNVSCSNALAASDYVLIPVMPSAQSTARVPVLLERLKEFRGVINPELKVMGVFANRTRGTELTTDEENKLTALKSQCRDAWGESVPLFATFIRQAAAIRDCEDERRTLSTDDDLFRLFAALAKEVESGVPTFCRPAAKTAAGVLS